MKDCCYAKQINLSFISYIHHKVLNTLQNLKVSSPALQTVLPSGLSAICKTLYLCPYSSAIFVMLGYFQTVI